MYAFLIIGFNFAVAYIISFWSFIFAVGWFFLAIGFQFGKWYGGIEKEEELRLKEFQEESEQTEDDVNSNF